MTKKTKGPSYEEDFGTQFQRHILAVSARIPGFVMRCRDVLDANYFTADVHRAIAEALLQHIDSNGGLLPTKPTLFEDVKQIVSDTDIEVVTAALEEIYSEPVHDHAAVGVKVIAFGKRQAMLNAVLAGAERIDRGDPQGVEPLIRKAMLVGENVANAGVDYLANMEDRIKVYLSPEEKRVGNIQTGLAHLDYMLGGGLGRGQLGVILAPPKRGKSTCLINFGFGALSDVDELNVVHYSCEMGQDLVLQRYDDRLMGNLVRTKRSDPDEFVHELRKRAGAFVHGRLAVKAYPTRTASVDTLRSNLSILAAQGMHPDLVVVDYAGILKATQRRAGEFRHEQASIFEDLRAMAGEFNCAVWTAQQANRGSLDKDTLTMADISETFEAAAIADVLVAMCQTTDERADGTCRLFGAAVREAESEQTVVCKLKRESCRLTSTALFSSSESRVYTHFDTDHPDREGAKPKSEEPETEHPPNTDKKTRLSKARRLSGTKVAEAKNDKPRRRSASPNKRVSP